MADMDDTGVSSYEEYKGTLQPAHMGSQSSPPSKESGQKDAVPKSNERDMGKIGKGETNFMYHAKQIENLINSNRFVSDAY